MRLKKPADMPICTWRNYCLYSGSSSQYNHSLRAGPFGARTPVGARVSQFL